MKTWPEIETRPALSLGVVNAERAEFIKCYTERHPSKVSFAATLADFPLARKLARAGAALDGMRKLRRRRVALGLTVEGQPRKLHPNLQSPIPNLKS